VFCCGVGRLDGAELRLQQWLLTRLDAEAAMLQALAASLSDARLLVSYNGKCFDMPLLETRYRLARTAKKPKKGSDPIFQMGSDPFFVDTFFAAHLDLLGLVRRGFGRRWPDCRLARAEQLLLGFGRADDLPGAEAPAAWLNWLRAGNPARLGAVLRHNRLDLISLVALVPALAAVVRDPHRHGADLLALARGRLRRGAPTAARDLLQAAGPTLTVAEQLLLASLHRRLGAWSDAVALWEALAADAEPAALEALAKYHEHWTGDLAAALHSVQRLPPSAARTRRRDRLLRKLAERHRPLHLSATAFSPCLQSLEGLDCGDR
jgi:hypothetical protein